MTVRRAYSGARSLDDQSRLRSFAASAAESLVPIGLSLFRLAIRLGLRFWLGLASCSSSRCQGLGVGHVPVREEAICPKLALFSRHQRWAWWVVVFGALGSFLALAFGVL